MTFTTEAINKLRAYMKTQPPNRTGRFNPLEAGLTPLELNSINQYQSYAELLKVRDREDPGLNAEFDAAFVEWIREKAGWIPLRILMAAEPVELGKAGFDTAKVETFRKAYEAVLSEEKAKPGQLSAEAANALVASARDLGESVAIPYLLQKNTEHKSWSDLKPDRVEMFKKVRDPMVALTSLPPESKATLLVAARSLSPTIVAYPSAAEMRQETNFNAFAPFYKSQFAYGIALVMLLLSLGINASPSTTAGKVERGVYGIGLAALLTGIGLEVLGFNYRIHISGWAPVTNMYETVIWVALVSSVLGFVLELIYRKKYAATAAAGVALLGTVLAANVSLLDPDIKNLQPVLRSNYWLTIHVLTIVSSYAAFALAMGLGLLAIGYYLSATYKRDVSYGKLALPLLPGVPLLVVGMYGLLARTNVSSAPTQMTMAEYSLAGMALGGLSLTIVALFGLIGEAASRASAKTLGAGLALLVAGVLGTASLSLGLETPEWWPSNLSLPVVPSLVAGLGLTMIILSRMGAIARAPLSEAPQSKPSSPKDEFAEAFPPPSPLTKKPTVAEIRARQEASRTELDPRSASMQSTAAKIKPLANFTYRAMQVGVLLVAAGTILGGVWADYSWGRFWGWDAKEVWALITLLVYLVPLHGRFAGWVNTFGLIASSVVCFASVMMAWYGVNFVLSTGLHAYGFTDGGGQGIVLTSCISIFAVVVGTWRRRRLGSIA